MCVYISTCFLICCANILRQAFIKMTLYYIHIYTYTYPMLIHSQIYLSNAIFSVNLRRILFWSVLDFINAYVTDQNEQNFKTTIHKAIYYMVKLKKKNQEKCFLCHNAFMSHLHRPLSLFYTPFDVFFGENKHFGKNKQ